MAALIFNSIKFLYILGDSNVTSLGQNENCAESQTKERFKVVSRKYNDP